MNDARIVNNTCAISSGFNGAIYPMDSLLILTNIAFLNNTGVSSVYCIGSVVST